MAAKDDECGCECSGETGVCLHTGAAEVEQPGAFSTVSVLGAKYSSGWVKGDVPSALDSPVGMNWLSGSLPFLSQCVPGEVAVVFDLCTAYWFTESDGSYLPQFGAKQTLAYDAALGKYIFTDTGGDVWQFTQQGQFDSVKHQNAHEVKVTERTGDGQLAKIARTTTAGGVTTTDANVFAYYDSGAAAGRIASITFQRSTNPTVEIRRMAYAYYGEGEDYGSPGDLKTATEQLLVDGAWVDLNTSYYRYYQEGQTGGFAHGLKYALGPEAFQRLQNDPLIPDPFQATDAQVAQYADHYFEYDGQRRAKKSVVMAGLYTYTYAYQTSSHADGYNHWKLKITVTRPDGAQQVLYNNFLGQTMLSDLSSGGDHWLEYHLFDEQAHEVLHAAPSAVVSYDDTQADLGVALRTDEGLIRATQYYATTTATPTTPGGAAGYVQSTSVQHGSAGGPVKLAEMTYFQRVAGPATVYPVAASTVFRNEDGTGAITTSFGYTWFAGTAQPLQKTTTLPVVPTSQNGSGAADTITEIFDEDGHLIWQRDPRGFITYRAYDLPTGAVTQEIRDVDGDQLTLPPGWTTPAGGGLHLVTDYQHDDLGRTTQTLGPAHTIDLNGVATLVRRATWTVYDDVNSEVRTAQGYATGANWDSFTLINPVSITKHDERGNVLEEIQAVRASTAGKLQPSDTFGQSTYVRWTTRQYNNGGQATSLRVYHAIPASGAGAEGANYDESRFGYDSTGRQNRTVSPGGTITRTVYDIRSQANQVYIGTNDTGATDADPTGGGASGNNMVVVTEHQYDGGSSGGDGNLTQQTQYVTATETRVTTYAFDWRNRQTDTDGELDFYQKTYYDNLDRVVKTERYDTTASGNLIARSETQFDNRARTYQTIRYAVDPATGTVGNSLVDNTWYDAADNPIKQLPGGTQRFTKTAYDSLGRAATTYVGFDTSESSYADATNVTGDTIFEQTETAYDAGGNVIQATHRARLHDATGTGGLSTPSGSQPRARVTYTAFYHDGVGRQVAQASYGDNGGASFSRSDTIPARSDTVLVSSIAYGDAGQPAATTDPAGKEDRTFYDDAGRVVRTVENYTDGDPTSGAADEDRTVEFTYTPDGQRATITARQQSSANDQTTTYVYGATLSDSDIARSDLLRAVIYPDSDDSRTGVPPVLSDGPDGVYDRVEHRYNRLGEIKETKDQSETVHAFEFDKLGRQTHDRITTLGAGVDGAVRRVSTTYDVRGLVEKITSYDNAMISSGNAVDEVVREYNDLGLLSKEYQEHGGAKTPSTPYVGYNYDTTASAGEFTKGLRLTSIRYPDGRLVHHTYGTSGSDDDNLNRLAAIQDDSSGSPGVTLAAYTYLGLNRVVIQDLPEPDIKLDLFGGASGTYAGIDRFDRVIDQRWYDYGSSTDVDRFKYGYDRSSDRTWRENAVSKNLSTPVYLDEFYTYDGLHRLKSMDRGELNATKIGITGTPSREEDWSLDPLDNWSNFVQKTSGTTDLDQDRAVNKVNEITNITESTGPSWITPTYDRNGNMTTIPKPTDPADSFTATYDAWNRMVKVEAGISTVAEYSYDGLHRRTTKTAGPTTRHFYYTSSWQAIEERIGSSTSPDRQFIWGPLYIDHLILRDRDTSEPSNGTLDERLYALQDANWNVITLADTSGDPVERYLYAAYGTSIVLTGGFGNRTASVYAWETLYCGYRWDNWTSYYSIRTRSYIALLGIWSQRDHYEDGSIGDRNRYLYVESRPLSRVDPYGEAPCPPTHYNAQLAKCQAKNAAANRTWLIFGCNYWKTTSYDIYQQQICETEHVHTCCFGPCQFYEGWCKWGAKLPNNDPGKWAWKLTVGQCIACADACALAGGKWTCKKGGGNRLTRPEWPSAKHPFEPTWDDDTSPKVKACKAMSTPGT